MKSSAGISGPSTPTSGRPVARRLTAVTPPRTIDDLVARVLVVAATDRELAPTRGWQVLRCGVGPVDAAAATAAAIAAHRPLVVLHVGIAGARRESGLTPPDVVVGTESIYCDLGVPDAWAPHRLAAPADLVEAACRAVPTARRLAIGTSGRVGRTENCVVEAMEGFGVLRAAALAGVPAIEVRAIANDVDEADRSRWRFDEAFAALLAVTAALVQEIAACRR